MAIKVTRKTRKVPAPAPPPPPKPLATVVTSATIVLDGDDLEMMTELTRMNVSVPDVMSSNAYPHKRWVTFLDNLRESLTGYR